eukprot:gnl/TRDRNA2_/TRDRNA2_39403_c0_seq1.p1 gnl/TRDRNA2_/TRDRNA2_39403_c0~~gnl/TRDRNA2_/TRDRNA2_39403_c0_seq1.p1  ORF type:complete len:504 (-),score=53.48 gnl/TRDRNA2_/TRDRNA2_39403_c0_seq1:57-1568(-)
MREDEAKRPGNAWVLRTEEVSNDRTSSASEAKKSARAASQVDVTETPKVSPAALTVNLVNACLGCGILSLPWATAGASILPGAAFTFLVLSLNAGTIMILVIAAERTKVFDLGGLFRRMPGRWTGAARFFCDTSIWVSVFLCLVSYIIVVTDAFDPLVASYQYGRSLCIWVVSVTVLPLCFLDQSYLAFASSLGIAANVYIFVLTTAIFAGKDKHAVAAQCCLLGLGSGSISMVSALMQAAIVQMCVLPMYEQLDQRSPRLFAKCLGWSFGFIFLLFTGFSTMAYLTYGPRVSSNVLKDLPHSISGNVARAGMAIAVLCVYPILITSMIAPIRHSEERAARCGREFQFPSPQSNLPSPIPSPHNSPSLGCASAPLLCDGLEEPFDGCSPYRRCWESCSLTRFPTVKSSHLATMLIVVLSGVGAMQVHDLGTVNILNGALQVAGLVSLSPGLVGIFLLGWESRAWLAAMTCLIIFGAVMSVVGLFFTSNRVEEVAEACVWTVTP